MKGPDFHDSKCDTQTQSCDQIQVQNSILDHLFKNKHQYNLTLSEVKNNIGPSSQVFKTKERKDTAYSTINPTSKHRHTMQQTQMNIPRMHLASSENKDKVNLRIQHQHYKNTLGLSTNINLKMKKDTD